MKFPDFFRNNAISLVLFAMFFAFVYGESASGMYAYNDTQQANGKPTVTYVQYLKTGNFLDGAFSNWQAALFQLLILITFGVVLRQQGTSHSRKLSERKRTAKSAKGKRSLWQWLYERSLSFAFALLFLTAFGLHIVYGAKDLNEQRALTNLPPVSIAQSLRSGEFWFKTFQTWEAEMFALAMFIVLTIFLRQRGSPESKPVESSNRDTGVVDT